MKVTTIYIYLFISKLTLTFSFLWADSIYKRGFQHRLNWQEDVVGVLNSVPTKKQQIVCSNW